MLQEEVTHRRGFTVCKAVTRHTFVPDCITAGAMDIRGKYMAQKTPQRQEDE